MKTVEDFITELKQAALTIMAEPPATATNNPMHRADRLEFAMRCVICISILNGDITFEECRRLNEGRYKPSSVAKTAEDLVGPIDDSL